jgi:uncharacterized DUF497 family protein
MVIRRNTLPNVAVDCRHQADYMADRHGVTVEQANQALTDPDALVFDPDYASRSGRGVRTIGGSPSAGRLLTVITVTEAGVIYGVNGWPANDTDTRHYQEGLGGQRDK